MNLATLEFDEGTFKILPQILSSRFRITGSEGDDVKPSKSLLNSEILDGFGGEK